MSEKITHYVQTQHERFPRTRCGRTLDLKRERRHRVVFDVEAASCPRCQEMRVHGKA